MQNKLLPVFFAIVIAACNNQPPEATAAEKMKAMPVKDSTTSRYTPAMVDNKKDPACGMPLTAGLEDTCHYRGKAYGFCSKECKAEFVKDPTAYLAPKK